MKRSENHRVTLTILNPIEWYATMGLCTDKLQLDQGLVMILGFRLAGLAVLDDSSLQAKTKIIHVCSEIDVIYWHGKSQLFVPVVRAGCYFLCAVARYSLNASTFTSNTVTVVSEILIC